MISPGTAIKVVMSLRCCDAAVLRQSMVHAYLPRETVRPYRLIQRPFFFLHAAKSPSVRSSVAG
jgi:hypothetical protein